MKKKLLFLLLTLSTSIFGQSNFSNGFSDGYKKGFCQNQGNGCISPLPPISPIPNVNEKMNSYQDGYNRGFEIGLNSQKSSNNTTNERFKAQSVELSKDNIYKADYTLVQNKMQSMDKLIESSAKNIEAENYEKALEDAEKLNKLGAPKEVTYCIKSRVFTARNENPIEAYNYGIYAETFCLENNPELKAKVYKNLQLYLLEFMVNEDYKNLQVACTNVCYETSNLNYFKALASYYQKDYNTAKKHFKKCDESDIVRKFLESIDNKIALPNPYSN